MLAKPLFIVPSLLLLLIVVACAAPASAPDGSASNGDQPEPATRVQVESQSGSESESKFPALAQAEPAEQDQQAAEAPTPAPTIGPEPTEASVAANDGNGDWTYFGPGCPGLYDNCAGFTSESISIAVRPAEGLNEPPNTGAWITLRCSEGNEVLFTFNTDKDGLPGLAGDLVLGQVWVGDFGDYEDDTIGFEPDYVESDLSRLVFREPNSLTLAETTRRAEQSGKLLVFGAFVDGDYPVETHFRPGGFEHNYGRLPCAK